VYRVPAGFRGPFIIVKASNGEAIRFEGSKVTISVPRSGIARIQDDSVFFTGTHGQAEFEDGTPLPISYEVGPDFVSLHSGGHGSGLGVPPHHTFFVGTAKEYEQCDYSLLRKQLSKSGMGD
jgi:hypothetical protein